MPIGSDDVDTAEEVDFTDEPLPATVVDAAVRLTKRVRATDGNRNEYIPTFDDPIRTGDSTAPSNEGVGGTTGAGTRELKERTDSTAIERRDRLLDRHDYSARVREDDDATVLVLYPASWREDGVIRTDRIEDLSRAIEIPLDGSQDSDEWAAVDHYNRELVNEVRSTHGDVHGDNAEAFADFMGNHYSRRIDAATEHHRDEFLTAYFIRNAWPTPDQRAVVEKSLAILAETSEQFRLDRS